MAFFRNSVAACVGQETGQRKHRTSLSEQPAAVCRDSPPRSELSLLCVCSFTSVNAQLQHYSLLHASSNTTTVIFKR